MANEPIYNSRKFRAFGSYIFLLFGAGILAVGLWTLSLPDTRTAAISAYNQAIESWQSNVSTNPLLNAAFGVRAKWEYEDRDINRPLALDTSNINDKLDDSPRSGEVIETYQHIKFAIHNTSDDLFSSREFLLPPRVWFPDNYCVSFHPNGDTSTALPGQPLCPFDQSMSGVYVSQYTNYTIKIDCQLKLKKRKPDVKNNCAVKCEQEENGFWEARGSSVRAGTCWKYRVLSGVCAAVEKTENGFTVTRGCYANGGFAMYRNVDANKFYSLANVHMEVRDQADPFLVAADSTLNTFNFGASRHQRLIVGVVLSCLGGLMCVLPFILTWWLLIRLPQIEAANGTKSLYDEEEELPVKKPKPKPIPNPKYKGGDYELIEN
eukprot:GILJ01002625.1.p1 GENE.GILJ01002625.1~~GILJ01002625.1.p1  ORF type:complete len:409 (-),score=62.21 GILJ01002625.1:56-1189(-)